MIGASAIRHRLHLTDRDGSGAPSVVGVGKPDGSISARRSAAGWRRRVLRAPRVPLADAPWAREAGRATRPGTGHRRAVTKPGRPRPIRLLGADVECAGGHRVAG